MVKITYICIINDDGMTEDDEKELGLSLGRGFFYGASVYRKTGFYLLEAQLPPFRKAASVHWKNFLQTLPRGGK